MILDDEVVLIREASNSCQDPIKLLFDYYDDESSSLNLLNRYMNIEGFKWKQSSSGIYYRLVNDKDEIHCSILKDPHGVGSMNITTYAFNEECRNKLHNIFTTLDMIYVKIKDSSNGFYVRYNLHDTCYNSSYFNRKTRIIV